MRKKIAASILLVQLAITGTSAFALEPKIVQQPRCRVIGGEKLPPASGGAEALCTAIEQRALARTPEAYRVEVRVLSPSVLLAKLTAADGRHLPEQRYSVADREFTRNSFRRFAEAIASALGTAERR